MTAQHLPLVSIVLLNWNGIEDTKICLENLQLLDYANCEIIVVDNGSAAEQKEYLRNLPNIIYVDNARNKGFTGGHIDGLRHAKGDYILLLNNDAVMKADYVTKAVKLLEDPRVAAVGGRSYLWNDNAPLLDESNPFYAYMDIDMFTGEAHMQTSDYGQPQEVNTVSGSAMIIRRSVIDEVGYLYNRFFAYFEETDLMARIKRAGYTVLYDPSLHIWHRVGASSGASAGSSFFYYQIFRNRFIFAVRNFEPWFLRRFLYNYFRISLVSTLQIFRDPSGKVMHKAYAKAGLYNLLTAPRAFLSRRSLARKLGATHYSSQIYKEQVGVSIVVDATMLSLAELKDLATGLPQDTNDPKQELVIVHRHPELTHGNSLAVRYVLDRWYFATHPLNLGCVAARNEWMLLCDARDMPSNIAAMNNARLSTLGTENRLVSFQLDQNRASSVLLAKALFQHLGGLGAGSYEYVTNHLIQYAGRAGCLHVDSITPAEHTVALAPETTDQQASLDGEIRYDAYLQKLATPGRFKRFQKRHYRFFQFVTFAHWLVMVHIPLRLKFARLKNLVSFTVRFKVPLLAKEFKHIRDEVLLYGGIRAILERRESIVKSQLTHALAHPNQVPVFIICRDRVEPLEKLVKWLERHDITNIVFIDNDSAYPPLLQYYESTPYQVLKLMRNVGHTSPWTLSIIRALVPHDFYIVSDPDVIPAKECPSDFLSYFLGLHKEFFAYDKIGFGLKIDDLPDHYPLKKEVLAWEGQFWRHPLREGVYEASVDTTFALYKPLTYTYTLNPSIRTGEPYVARHLPWYIDSAKTTAEETFYRYRVDLGVTSWNTDVLDERYVTEMEKQSNH